jgi:hypothetical protein
MCAIVDANVDGEVFGASLTAAGQEFFEWVTQGHGRLVAGGKLLEELYKTPARDWAREAINSGRMKRVNSSDVEELASELSLKQICRSNDPHVIALAQISGARLLYSNDEDLQKDFKAKDLIDNPRGKVYTTLLKKDFTTTHRGLLARKDLCQAQ